MQRSGFIRCFFAFASVLAPLALAAAGCTTSIDPMLPDVRIDVDGGSFDGGPPDGGYPDPTIETCESPGETIGDACADDDACDDGCYCNGPERCEAGVCIAGNDPCVDAVECTQDSCLEETNACFRMPDHTVCSNGLACDGYEQCDRNAGCVPAAPLYCNDESACTVDSCDDASGCVYSPRDLDRDGFLSGMCGGDDCDDDPRYGTMIHPGATEVCDNRRDDDCDGRRDFNDDDCLPTNDTCELATILPERSGTYSGATTAMASNYTLACATTSGPDAVFRLTLTAAHDVRVAISGITNAAVVIRDFASCTAGPDLKCSSGSTPSVLSRSLPAGDYAIIVRTMTGAGGGTFDLNLMITDPTPVPPIDVCGPGTEPITASGTYRGRFEETNDDYPLSCHASGSWRDAAYRLVLAADSDVVITANAAGGSFSTTYVSLVTDCADTTTTIQCASSSGTPEIRRRGMAAGTYFILIESSTSTATEWTLNVTITTPPAPRAPGDACGTVVPVALSGTGDMQTGMGTASITSTYELDGGTSCGGSTSSYRDVYFELTLPNTRDVTVTTNGAGFHYAAVQGTCGVSGSELRCRSGSGALAQTWRSLPAGTYFVVVSTTLNPATVTATVETRPATAIPPNDRCDGAITLTDGSSFNHTLVGFEDDLASCTGSGRPDAFYTFTLATSRRVIISASAMSGTPTMYLAVRNNCAAEPTVTGGCVSTTSPATINQVLPAGTYSVMVEMTSFAAADFNISYVTLAP
ncbi:MAG: hypothetical protein M3Y87_04320 [Myxococcota bacterium]|nr:hypothetical protein [Myxococcota bacterium]